MELKEFVSQSLLQIFQGIQQAQEQLGNTTGKIVPAYPYPKTDGGSIIASTNSQPVVLVDFDVSVTSKQSEKAKGGFSIVIIPFGGGLQATSESSNNNFNHLKFSVPVLLPRPN